jgi:hypothetical protein
MRPLSTSVNKIGIIFLLVLFSKVSHAQPDGVRIDKKSNWITTISYNAESKPESGQGSSYYYLLLDEQENTITQENFYHYAYTILTSEGIQGMSDLNFDFDPSYQELILHEIRIIRGTLVIDQLSKNIQVIQREQSMDRYLYDGSRTAIVNLKDIRVGDIVEYSFTRKGYNPVHDGHITGTYYFDFYQPIDKYYKKIILHASKDLEMKILGKEVLPAVIKQIKNEIHYEWAMDKIKAIQSDIGAPVWHDSNNGVMLSDFRSWGKVGDWARKLFKLSNEDKKWIKTDVAGNFPVSTDKEYILSVIRFVQDEVRYLGFEGGINSHKPYSPKQVYEQRFGDCKDKSLLLATLLQAREIEAYPMLVNTTLKHTLDERLPAGNIFDHCVVQIIFNANKIYIDPTISNQGGTLENIYFPDYRRGLVVDNDILALDTLPEPPSPTTAEIQNFDLLTIGGEAMLTVRTSYSGADADYQRSQFATTPLETIKKNYRDFYANLYPDITIWEDPTFTDNRASNVFILEEKYKIPTFWKPLEGEEGKIYCTLQPQSITHYFDVPKNIQQRTSPYYLRHPTDFYHTIHIRLPEEWMIEPIDKIIENDFYQYEYEVKKIGNEISRITHYKTKSDHIPVEKVPAFVEDHASMYNNLVYQLSYDKNVGTSKNPWPGIILTVLLLLGGAYLMFALYHRYDPAPERYMVLGSPIGGWLILLGIAVVFSPFRLLFDFTMDPDLLTGNAWMICLASKQYGLFSYLIFAQVYNVLKLLFSVLLLVLFFQRRSSFPMLMTIQIAFGLVITLADELITEVVNTDGTLANYKEIGRALFSAVIWVPYLHLSQRVKETFTIRANRGGGNNPAPQYEMATPHNDFSHTSGQS